MMRRRGGAVWATVMAAALSSLFMVSGVRASNTVTMTFFEPEAFYRDTGGPETEARIFTVPAIQGDFTLSLDNGNADGDSLTSGAVVKVNGVMVIKTSDLNQQVAHLEKDLNPYVIKGDNILEVEIRSIPSSYITISIDGVYLLDIQMTDPVTGSSLDTNKATVQGTWQAYTNDIGIVVNGVTAGLSGGVFVASEVPLVAGTNTLTATITTFEEIRDTAAVNVTASGEEPAVDLWSNVSSGVAPLPVTFRTDTNGIDAVEYRYDLDGNGVVDIYALDDDAVSYTYQYAGINNATVTVIDAAAQEYTSYRTVVIEDRDAVDTLLTGRWDSVTSSLIVQDVEGSLKHFSPANQERYREIFNPLKDQLPGIFSALPPAQFITVKENKAKYRVRREQVWDGVPRLVTYYLWFVRDTDGLWKLDEF